MKLDYKTEYERWLRHTEGDVLEELRYMKENEIEDAFYRNLSFGTGGLRGIIGSGTNRMNTYVIRKASQGLANYLGKGSSVVIGFDSRIKSELFAKTAASVFAANDVKVHLWSELLPVPTVSFAVRYLHASAGVMITASHNPSKYNGYKVYGSDGCQITTDTANAILAEIKKLDIFADIKNMSFEDAIVVGTIKYIDDAVLNAFLDEEKNQSVLFGEEINKEVAIVYSPLNGTGLKPVIKVLEDNGYTNITVVEEQRDPDGNFPTCPYPNPEIREAMELGLQYAARFNADLFLATDPDCDRCGIAVRTASGDYSLLSGNEVGLLLLDYICSQRKIYEQMPDNPMFVKTIVTTDLAEKIADHYGVETINVLTGFKFIGEVIGKLEEAGREKDYIFGFEESYGYLTGSFVRDKDAVNAAFMICEMFAFYKTRGISLIQKLNELYSIYGYCLNTLHSFEFEGSAGMMRMAEIMKAFRSDTTSIGPKDVLFCQDYLQGINGLPKSDVLKYQLKDDCSVVIRPSGTEPKLKVYISITANNRELAEEIEKSVAEDMKRRIG